ncbi:MAG: SelL-related redox protein [Myxococcota bacterium]
MKVGERIPDAVLDRAVVGLHVAPGTLRDQLGDAPTLLVFLRHFGCMFCRETLADLRGASQADARFPRVLLFFQGTLTEGRALLRRYWPDVPAIADPALELYDAFGVERGSWAQMLGPPVWPASVRARAKGHRNAERSGDIWRMPGMFLCRGSEVAWTHAYRSAGDAPDYAAIAAIARATR